MPNTEARTYFAREIISAEVSQEFPTMVQALRFSYALHGFLIPLAALLGSTAIGVFKFSPEFIWSGICILASASIVLLILQCYTIKPFVRGSLEGLVIDAVDGRLQITRKNGFPLSCNAASCVWCEIEDLQTFLGNRAFPPDVSCIVAAESTAPKTKPVLVVCGFSEDSRAMWRHYFKSYGAIEKVL